MFVVGPVHGSAIHHTVGHCSGWLSSCEGCGQADDDERHDNSCTRLDKPCSSQTPAPPRRRKEPRPTKVAELERRLVELTTRIESSQATGSTQQRQVSVPSGQQSPGRTQGPQLNGDGPIRGKPYCPGGMFSHIFPDPEARSGTGASTSTLTSTSTRAPTATTTTTTTTTTANSGPTSSTSSLSSTSTPRSTADVTTAKSVFGDGTMPGDHVADTPADVLTARMHETASSGCPWPLPVEAEAWLAEYRVRLAQLMPFVVLPATTPSAELRSKRPLLWKAVMLATCQLDGPRQIAMGKLLLRELSEAALTRPQRGLDVVQAMQAILYWYHYNLNSFQVTNLLYLLRSLCANMGWAESQSQTAAKLKEAGSAGLEQMRAYCGVYYATTL
jgi:hypothetical protein